MNSSEIQKILQTIVKRVRCPHCGRQYSFEDIHILSSTGSVCFLQLECGNHMPTLASVAVSGQKITIEKNQEKISTNDLLEAHEKLSQIESIKELFR